MTNKTLRQAAQMASDALMVLCDDEQCTADAWDAAYASEAIASLQEALGAALALPDEPDWIEVRLPKDCQAIEGKSSVDGPVWIEDWDKDEPLGSMRFWRPAKGGAA